MALRNEDIFGREGGVAESTLHTFEDIDLASIRDVSLVGDDDAEIFALSVVVRSGRSLTRLHFSILPEMSMEWLPQNLGTDGPREASAWGRKVQKLRQRIKIIRKWEQEIYQLEPVVISSGRQMKLVAHGKSPGTTVDLDKSTIALPGANPLIHATMILHGADKAPGQKQSMGIMGFRSEWHTVLVRRRPGQTVTVPVELVPERSWFLDGFGNVNEPTPRELISRRLVSDLVEFTDANNVTWKAWLEADVTSTTIYYYKRPQNTTTVPTPFPYTTAGPVLDFVEGGLSSDAGTNGPILISKYKAEDPGGGGEIECKQINSTPGNGNWDDPVCGDPREFVSDERQETLCRRRVAGGYLYAQLVTASVPTDQGRQLVFFERQWDASGTKPFKCPPPNGKKSTAGPPAIISFPADRLWHPQVFHAAATANGDRCLARVELYADEDTNGPVLAVRIAR